MPTEKEPSKSPSASSVAVAESRLAMPSGAITSSPEAFSIWTLSPKLRSASLSATFTTATPLTSERSKETAAFVSDWPAIVSDRQAGAADPQEVAAGRGVDGDLHRRRVEGDARQAHVDRAAERPGDAGRADGQRGVRVRDRDDAAGERERRAAHGDLRRGPRALDRDVARELLAEHAQDDAGAGEPQVRRRRRRRRRQRERLRDAADGEGLVDGGLRGVQLDASEPRASRPGSRR